MSGACLFHLLGSALGLLDGCAEGRSPMVGTGPASRVDGGSTLYTAAADVGATVDASRPWDSGEWSWPDVRDRAMDAVVDDVFLNDAFAHDAFAHDAFAHDASSTPDSTSPGDAFIAHPLDAACVGDTATACVSACGTVGTSRCTSGRFGPCVPPRETCNGTDDDCDGEIDDGFRARVATAMFAALDDYHTRCDGATERIGLACNTAIHRLCRDGCATSGFGPTRLAGETAAATCVVAEVRSVPFSTLRSHQDLCSSEQMFSSFCNSAVHRYCLSQGFPSGFGILESAGEHVVVACVRSAEVRETTYGELAGYQPACNGVSQHFGPECNTAIHDYCVARGFVSGFGPVEHFADRAWVSCVRS